MASSFSDDILSAYLDDELPLDERASVAAWLDASPEARRTLAGLRRLRVCFEELPRAELPREFAAEVLQQAERQMLLPAAADLVAAPRGWRRWLLPAMVTASAASIALVLALQTDRRGGDRAAARPVASQHEAARERPALAGDSRTPVPAAAAKPGEALSVDTEDALPAALPATAGSPDVGAEVDELVDAIRAAGDAGQVPVVQLFVVDGHADLRFVQWVVEKNQAGSTAADSPEAPRASADGALGATAEGGTAEALAAKKSSAVPRQGLLVIASPGQLGDVLQTLLEDKGRILGVRVDAPIDVARLDAPARRIVEEEQLQAASDKAPEQAAGLSAGRALAGTGTGHVVKNFAADEAAGRSQAASTRDVARQRGRPAASPVDRAVVPARDADVPGRLKQLVVSMPESAAARSNRTNVEPQAQAAKEKPAAATSDAAAQAAEAAREPGTPPSPALVRVIIVVEPQSAAEKRPQPPATPSEGGHRQRAGRSRVG